MVIEVPVFIHVAEEQEAGGRVHCIEPLFSDGPRVARKNLRSAVRQFVSELAEKLSQLAKQGSHRLVAQYAFCPEPQLHRLTLRLSLRRQSLAGFFPVVVFRCLQRQLAFSPLLRDVWFEIGRGDRLEEKACEVYTQYFQRLERTEDDDSVRSKLQAFSLDGKAWLDFLEFSLETAQKLETAGADLLAWLGGQQVGDGERELRKVGQCLDHLYPDGLHRFRLDPKKLQELDQHLASGDRRPVLVVGPPQVGKTSLVHEVVCQRVERRGKIYQQKNNVWRISPQRLISGMMYVGQWEQRLLAILAYAKRNNHVLYFDDMLGLYQAGQTSNSTLSVAEVLKPHVRRGDVWVLAEMASESLRVFRERDRGFADSFHLIHIDEPPESRNLSVLLGLRRELEQEHGCRFDIDVLPAVLELTRRYQPEAAYPGKAAGLLKQLAMKGRHAPVTRQDVIVQFQSQCGWETRFLDRNKRLRREEAVEALARQILGQSPAVEAMADIVTTAKAGLNDPHKPLGSLLLLGPTGVGKTECAKALARLLFGDESRLLRFDMNEFVTAESVARLVGTFGHPEGLLIGAVRRQPFGVLLLDEIEKAHADVFDLLLQVLGEARLSDALGRTVNFSNMIVILTSNLGAREADRELGFGGQQTSRRERYLKAVREFFRPEFVNRLDHVIPFDPLGREELNLLAARTLLQVLAREGFSRRKCALDLSPEALECVVRQGWRPALGARAMKRAVEDIVVRPAAQRLAGIRKEAPALMWLGGCGGRLACHVQPFVQAEPAAGAARPIPADDPQWTLARAHQVLQRLARQIDRHRPSGGIQAGRVLPQHVWYLGYADMLGAMRDKVGAITEARAALNDRSEAPAIPARRPRRSAKRLYYLRHTRNWLKEMAAAEDVLDYFEQIQRRADGPGVSDDDDLSRILDELALLDALGPTDAGWPPERTLVLLRGLGDSEAERAHLKRDLLAASTFAVTRLDRVMHSKIERVELGLSYHDWSTDTNSGEPLEQLPDARRRLACCGEARHTEIVAFQGFRSFSLLSRCAGAYLFYDLQERLKPVRVEVLRADPPQSYCDVLMQRLSAEGQERMTAAAEPERGADALQWPAVTAVYAWQRRANVYCRVLDLQLGATACSGGSITAADALLGALPLPREFEE